MIRRLMINLHYKKNAVKAIWHYRRSHKPCLSCVWEIDEDYNDWQWIYCLKCDWGNQ